MDSKDAAFVATMTIALARLLKVPPAKFAEYFNDVDANTVYLVEVTKAKMDMLLKESKEKK